MTHIIGRFAGLESRGISVVTFTKGIVRGIVTENFARWDGAVWSPAAMQLKAVYVLADGRRIAYDDLNQVQRADAIEKVAWLRRECDSKGIRVLA